MRVSHFQLSVLAKDGFLFSKRSKTPCSHAVEHVHFFVCLLSVAFREGVCTTFADSSTCSQDDLVRFDVRAARRPKLAVLLTGFAKRSIQFTANSAQRRVLIPCRSYGYDVDVFVYSFYSEKGLDVDETRGGEELASPETITKVLALAMSLFATC